MALVTPARYIAITRDTNTSAEDIAAELAAAQELVEAETGRPVESAERTERMRIRYGRSFPGGRVYPAATPVTVAADHTIVGTTALDGASPDAGIFDRTDEDYATVTYTGGYTAETVPADLERVIARAAYRLLNADLSLPVGATSVRLGDAAVTYDGATSAGTPFDDMDRAVLRRYRRRTI